MTEATQDKTTKSSSAGSRRPQRNTLIKMMALLVVVIMILIWAGHWLLHRLGHVSSDDARVSTHEITVSSRIAGRVTHFSLRRGDHLNKNQTVAKLYSKPERLKLRQLEAKQAAASARVDTEKMHLQVARKQTASGVKQAKATLATDQAKLKVAKAKLAQARDKAQRTQRLYKTNSASKQQRNTTRYTARARARAVNAAKKQVQFDKVAVANAKTGQLSRPPMHLTNAKIAKKRLKTLRDQLAAARAAVKHEQNRVHDLTVVSPINGVVDKRFINPSEYVSAGQPIVMMHAPKKVWIEAKIKETKIRSLKIGQPVNINVDARPNTQYSGHVKAIGKAATDQFNLLPPPNPSGNFTKITQRIPVRVAISHGPKAKLSPGMMVEVNINIDGDVNSGNASSSGT